MASRRSRSSAAAARRSSRCATASRCSMRLPEVDFIDDKAGKPVGINSTSAAGRSSPSATPTATCRCCEWTTAGDGARFGLLVHHTDAEREWAYDRESHIGKLDKALDEAQRQGLDRRRHEKGLERGLSVRKEVRIRNPAQAWSCEMRLRRGADGANMGFVFVLCTTARRRPTQSDRPSWASEGRRSPDRMTPAFNWHF